MIGTNRELESIRRMLDDRIAELSRCAGSASCPCWVPDLIAAFGRQRTMLAATLANRRIEAVKKVVDLGRWYNGDGALFRDALIEAAGAGTPMSLGVPRF
jgi:hypothetical protein